MATTTNDKKTNNPYNKECSSIKQAVLDMDGAGFPAELIKPLLEYIDNNKDDLSEADKRFHNHQYPEHSIKFTKLSNEHEVFRFLSTQAISILMIMVQHMRHGNKFQVSCCQLQKYSTISNKNTIHKAINELIDKGCITCIVENLQNEGPIYMVNPLIATVGQDQSYLITEFWKLTGSKTEYVKNDIEYTEYSEPHKAWNELDFDKTYSIGYGKQKISEKVYYYYNRFNPAKTKKSSSAPTLDDQYSSEEE